MEAGLLGHCPRGRLKLAADRQLSFAQCSTSAMNPLGDVPQPCQYLQGAERHVNPPPRSPTMRTVGFLSKHRRGPERWRRTRRKEEWGEAGENCGGGGGVEARGLD
jgi:hypothetical protein